MPLRFRFILVLVFPLLAGGFIQAKELVIVAHRGVNHLAPENTIAATQKYVDLGLDYVEIDVRTSKDGVMYILHDKTLDRTTNGSGEIKERGSEYIDQLGAGSWFGPEFTDQRVPRLKPYLRQFKGKIKIYFVVKAADLAELVALVHEAGFARDWFFWFFKDDRARELRALDRHIPLKMNAVDVTGLRSVMDYNPQIIEYRLEHLTPDFIAFCREHDLKLMAHALGEGFETKYQEIIDSAADIVNLDRADEMIERLK